MTDGIPPAWMTADRLECAHRRVKAYHEDWPRFRKMVHQGDGPDMMKTGRNYYAEELVGHDLADQDRQSAWEEVCVTWDGWGRDMRGRSTLHDLDHSYHYTVVLQLYTETAKRLRRQEVERRRVVAAPPLVRLELEAPWRNSNGTTVGGDPWAAEW